MKNFDQIIASESPIDGEELVDEVFEDIEAPKFVDLTVPDHNHPDDRYWFCLRVGCDQKHEEELNWEEINKNFVLRVMAARSPNIKIRKMLTGKSSALKCPQTVPAKPAKSRISRLAIASSISRKLIYGKDEPKPLSKPTTTPKAISKQKNNSVETKALTTPRNRKKISNNIDNFRSVRNPTPKPSIAVPKTKVMAKALIFRSPKKVVRVKTSIELKTPVGKLCAAMTKLEIATGKKRPLELKTPVGKLCAAMSKLEIASAKKQASLLHLDKTAKKQFRGREVKSRVFDSLKSQSQKGHETKPTKSIKRKKRETDKICEAVCSEVLLETPRADFNAPKSSEAEKQRSSNVKIGLDDITDSDITCSEVLLGSPKTDFDIPMVSNAEEEKVKSSDVKIGLEDITNCDDKENNLPSVVDAEADVNESDEKENTTAFDDNNRVLNNYSEVKILVNNGHKKVHQVMKKPLKMTTVSATCSGAQEAKYRKPKPTISKPFRLRTDERGILKEATLEKKLITPLREITTTVLKAKSSRKIPTPSQGNDDENIQRQTETRTEKIDVDRPRKISTYSRLRTKNATSTTQERTTKSQKIPVKLQGIGMNRKTVKPGIVKESLAKPSENRTTITAVASNPPRSVSRGKRTPITIPREPNFHSIHVPKNCTKKTA